MISSCAYFYNHFTIMHNAFSIKIYSKIMISAGAYHLLKNIVGLPTTTNNKKEQRQVLKVIQKYLSAFQVQYFSKKGFCSAFFYPKSVDIKSMDIILSGHIDVVSAPKNMFKLIKKGDKLLGRGVFDMKGPLVALVEALNLYYKNGGKLRIGLLVTSDEELGGYNGTKFFLEKTKIKSKLAIVPDGGNNFEIVIAEKGVLDLLLSYKGVPAHVARPWEGNNAAEQLIRVVNKIIQHFPPGTKNQWQTMAVVTSFETQTKANNILPHFAKARINFRFIKDDTPEQILAVVKKVHPGVKIKICKFANALEIWPRSPFVQLFKKIVQSHVNFSPQLVRYPSACDARFFAAKNIPVIITRPSGGNAHGKDEWASLSSLDNFGRILVSFFKTAEHKG